MTLKTRRKDTILLLRQARTPLIDIAKAIILWRSSIPWKCKIEPEQRICIEFADALRELTIHDRYQGIWGHLANEGKRHPLVALIMIGMGMLPGSPDYFFMGKWGHGVIEFKTPGKHLEDTQACYRDWCDYNGVNHAICHSREEGIEILKSWGAIPTDSHAFRIPKDCKESIGNEVHA